MRGKCLIRQHILERTLEVVFSVVGTFACLVSILFVNTFFFQNVLPNRVKSSKNLQIRANQLLGTVLVHQSQKADSLQKATTNAAKS